MTRHVESALALGKGVVGLAFVDEKLPETKWRTEFHSQHYACDRCGRSFEPLTPHSFSFNSWLGWCAACELTSCHNSWQLVLRCGPHQKHDQRHRQQKVVHPDERAAELKGHQAESDGQKIGRG